MSQGVIVTIMLGVLPFIVGLLTYLGATRANKSQTAVALATVDQKAYEQAQKIYESAIHTLEGQVTGLENQVTGLQTRVVSLESLVSRLGVANDSLDLQLHQLRRSNHELTTEISRFKKSNDKKDGINE